MSGTEQRQCLRGLNVVVCPVPALEQRILVVTGSWQRALECVSAQEREIGSLLGVLERVAAAHSLEEAKGAAYAVLIEGVRA